MHGDESMFVCNGVSANQNIGGPKVSVVLLTSCVDPVQGIYSNWAFCAIL